MALSCGIVGHPNVGKSTIFNALTSGKADAANFPFCTIDPNVGIVPVPDPRIYEISKRVNPTKTTPTAVTFIDIAGLVKGAADGEGLGNQFLGQIKKTNAVIHVVRCFEDENIAHVDGKVDPINDIDVVNVELMLADLATVTRRWERDMKIAKSQPKEKRNLAILEKVKLALENGQTILSLKLNHEEKEQIQNLHLITDKPTLYVLNIDEKDLKSPEQNIGVQKVLKRAKGEGSEAVIMCGKIESEISELSDDERGPFLESMGMHESALDRLVHVAYRLLGLITFFTMGPTEVRAWTVHKGAKAPEAAGEIHTDFQRGFIKGEVFHYDDLIACGSEAEIRAKGLLRMEGKDYVVKDGDVIFFKFNI